MLADVPDVGGQELEAPKGLREPNQKTLGRICMGQTPSASYSGSGVVKEAQEQATSFDPAFESPEQARR